MKSLLITMAVVIAAFSTQVKAASPSPKALGEQIAIFNRCADHYNGWAPSVGKEFARYHSMLMRKAQNDYSMREKGDIKHHGKRMERLLNTYKLSGDETYQMCKTQRKKFGI